MANLKISELTQLSSADNADLFAIVDSSAGETKYITSEDYLSSIGFTTLASAFVTHVGNSAIHFEQSAISIPASQISDFDTEVSNNTNVAANTNHIGLTNNPHSVTYTQTGADASGTASGLIGTHESTYNHSDLHTIATVLDSTTIDFTLTGQQITASIIVGAVDHDSLLNYVANEHIDWTNATSNFLTTGTATVPTIYGSSASGGNLTLNSTSHATKGKIFFGASSAYDAVNVRLGIGTTSPGYDLHVVGINSHYDTYSDSAATAFGVTMKRSRGTSSTPSAVNANDLLGRVVFNGYTGSGWTVGSYGVAGIVCAAAENFSATNNGSRLQFYTTASGGTTTSEKMRLDNNGNLGINTTSPSEKLHVDGNQILTGNLTVDTNTFFVDSVNNKVGIGTTSPTSTLSVTGESFFSGNVGIGIAPNSTNALYVRPLLTDPASTSYAGLFSPNITITADSTTLLAAARYSANLDTGTFNYASTIYGAMCVSTATGTSGTINNMVGILANNLNSGGNTVTLVRNFYSAGGSNSGVGSITTFVGLDVANISVATNNYGVRLGVAASSTSYNIYASGSAQSYFAGNIGIGVNVPTEKLHVVGSILADQYKLRALNAAPSSASATGVLGEIRYDANYIYVCTATNTWKRVAIATW